MFIHAICQDKGQPGLPQTLCAKIKSIRQINSTHECNPSTQQVEGRGSGVQEHPWLHGKFLVNIGCVGLKEAMGKVAKVLL